MPKFPNLSRFIPLFFVLLLAAAPACAKSKSVPADPNCGISPSDWCPSPPDDPCGRHKNTEDCRADPSCEGRPYRGESAIACMFDQRGFATNCPTVGCRSLKENSKTSK
ncbi:MAG: hypothetical protein K8R69_11090 [Deltaproteobacteria bacterium]|nr:hypothetical protein [Deltaproteobacteria bacterium]